MTRISLQNLILAGLLVALCVGLSGCEDTSAQAANGPAVPTAQVRYTVLDQEDIIDSRELSGRVSAFTVSEVRPQVSGIIKERLFEEGSDVEAGQVLYRIDPELYQAAYNNAQAQVRQAEANAVSAARLAERYRSLVRTDAVSKQEYDDAKAADLQAKAAVEAAKEALETARINLSYTEITAPVSGRIGRSYVTPGALVTQNQGEALATVQQLSPIYTDLTMPSSELLKLRRMLSATSGEKSARIVLKLEDGSPYTLLADSGKSENPAWIEGEIMFSDVSVEQSTSTVSLRAKFDNPEEVLLPGMYVRAVILGAEAQSAILVPQKAVQRDASGKTTAYVLTKNMEGQQNDATRELNENEYYVERRVIEVGAAHGNNWQVNGGLEAGERLLVEGLQKVRPGQVVSGIPAESTTVNNSKSAKLAQVR